MALEQRQVAAGTGPEMNDILEPAITKCMYICIVEYLIASLGHDDTIPSSRITKIADLSITMAFTLISPALFGCCMIDIPQPGARRG